MEPYIFILIMVVVDPEIYDTNTKKLLLIELAREIEAILCDDEFWTDLYLISKIEMLSLI